MQTLLQDVRYGWRGILNRPGFACLAVLTLALGIGAATTIFSVIHNVLLDPFPYTNAHRVAAIQIRDLNNSRGGRGALQVAEFLDYQEQSHVFEDVIGGTNEDILLSTGDGTEQFVGGLTTGNTFQFLGVPAALGRTFTPDDAKPAAPPVFVMAHKMWLRQYNLDPGILGQTFVLNGVPTTLIGIMPKRVTKLAADLWRPINLDRADSAMSRRYFTFQARLKPGVTLEQASAELDVIGHRAALVYPTTIRRNSGCTSSAGSIVSSVRFAPRSTRSQRPSASCCSSPAATSRTCCWRARRRVKKRWPCARRSARADRAWCVSC